MRDSYRTILRTGATVGTAGFAAATAAATTGAPDELTQGLVATRGNLRAGADSRPQNPATAGQFPSAFTPPPADVGGILQIWASFNKASRRIQAGGGAWQVTQAGFFISESISGVNMRLDASGIRELHWHLATDWNYMSYGHARTTVLDPQGQSNATDVKVGDLWYFPPGYPRSLQGLGPEECEFILCFDDGKASENNTLFVSDWLIHTPQDFLALNFGMPAEAFSKMALHSLWFFRGAVPGPVTADQDAIKGQVGAPPNPFTYVLASELVATQTKGGFVQLADSSNFKVSTTIAAALVTIHLSSMREIRYHPHADYWQYYIKGSAQMMVVGSDPKAVTTNFNPGDIGYVKRSDGHYVRNKGDAGLVFPVMFNANSCQKISLPDWLVHTPSAIVAAHLNMSSQDIAKTRTMFQV